jgi:WD40 repeat protein/serine/threonine protein kinase
MSTPSFADPIGEIADAFVEAFRQGKDPSVDEYAARYPEYADELREILPALVLMEKAKAPEDESVDQAATSPALPLRRLGDYRILGEIGHGGMGVVYEAEQQSLGRRVALKILPFSASQDTKKAARFRREARSAARLHHTNIVPVFDVGQDGDTCYYAMQLIQGQGLDQVITELRRLRSHSQADKEIGFLSPASPVAECLPRSQEMVQVDDRTCAERASRAALALVSGTFERQTLPLGAAPAEPPEVVAVADMPTLGPSPDLHEPEPNSPVAASPTSSAVLPGHTELSSVESDHRHYFRSVARIGQQTAMALAHAHTRGVLHRDIKPSNLLLDAAGVVWVTDFGLAKTEADDLTGTGEILGTLRYMPPERFAGTSDARADVYSLGVTMYELLVLQPAFDSPDRMKLMAQVAADEPARPRSLDPRIPRDLETIVLKAIEKNPARRYQSAGDVAEDLRRFIDDEPIRARRTSAAERYWRWARRNPVIAVLGSVLTALLVLATAGSLIVASRMARLAENERNAATEANTRERAERWERYRSNIAAASAALQINNVSTAERALDAAPEQHRNWEWQYFHNQLDGASRVLSGPERLHRVKLSPNGQQCATPCRHNLVYLWDMDSTAGQPVHVLRGHAHLVVDVAYSPDGRQLATGSRDSIRLWDPATGQQLFVLTPDGPPSLIYSPDSKRLISDEDGGTYHLWDATTGKRIASLGLGHKSEYDVGVNFSPDGKCVAAIAGKEVRLYDAATGRQLTSLGPHEWDVHAVHFSPCGKRICTHQMMVGYPSILYLWDAETGRPVAKLIGHSYGISAAVFNPAGTLLATGSLHPENLVRVWDATNGKLLFTLSGHANTLNFLSFSPDGTRLASASLDQTARLWNAKTGVEVAVLRGHSALLRQVHFSDDSKRLVTESDDNTMRLWDAGNGDLIAVLRGHKERVDHFAQFTRNGSHVISYSTDGTVRIWDLDLVERNGVLRGHTSFVYDVAFGCDGEQVASAAWDGTARLWEATTGRQTALLKHPQPYVTSLAFSRDGRTLATANSQHGAVLWDLTTGKSHLAVPVQSKIADHTRVAFSPDGRFLASGDAVGRLVVIYDVREQKQFAELTQNDPDEPAGRLPAADPVFSPDGLTLVTAADEVLLLWDVATWKVLGKLSGHTGRAYRTAFSADGKLLASGGLDNTVRLWDPGTHEKLASINLGSSVYGLAFSPDGTRLAAGCRDNTIRLIDVASRQEVAELRGHTDYVHAVAWSPDGTRLASGSGDKSVRVWDSLSIGARAGAHQRKQ